MAVTVAATDPVALSQIPLFRGLDPSQLSELGGLLEGRAVPAGTVIAREEEPGDFAYVVRVGFVRIEVDQADGRWTILTILGPGDVVGEMSLVDRLGRSAIVVAHEPATLLRMGRAAFWSCLQRMPTMTYNLVRILSHRLRLANEQIEALATLDVEGRIARQLLVFAGEYGEPTGDGIRIPFRLSQVDIARLVGASRVRANQVIGDYRRHGYVSYDARGCFVVHQPPLLACRC